jgi:hypothetical protein
MQKPCFPLFTLPFGGSPGLSRRGESIGDIQLLSPTIFDSLEQQFPNLITLTPVGYTLYP